jgi:copper chaperone CopZ
MAMIRIQVEGMHCGACVKRLTAALSRVEGAEVREVRVGMAEVEAEPEREGALLGAVEEAGFRGLAVFGGLAGQ